MYEEKKLNMTGIFKGILFSLAATIISMLVITAICYFAEVTDKLLCVMIFAATVICIFGGARLVSKNAPSSGLMHGALLGTGYFIVLFIVSAVLQKGLRLEMYAFTTFVGCVSAGMLGGVFGINAKK